MRRPGGSLLVRNVAFTVVVPGSGAVLIPWAILRRHPPAATEWPGLVPIALGAGLYAWCAWVFATVGRGTPGEAAIVCHLFVVGYEEPTLRRRFGDAYEAYRRSVHRWVPRRPSVRDA
jgi:protein-S-isoprenylcysteine O-methyltransferase Ste14